MSEPSIEELAKRMESSVPSARYAKGTSWETSYANFIAEHGQRIAAALREHANEAGVGINAELVIRAEKAEARLSKLKKELKAAHTALDLVLEEKVEPALKRLSKQEEELKLLRGVAQVQARFIAVLNGFDACEETGPQDVDEAEAAQATALAAYDAWRKANA